MNTRRSKRLSKLPVLEDSEVNNGKKKRLDQKIVLPNEESKEEEYGKDVDENSIDGKDKPAYANGNDSDSSDSSVDYMKSPQAIDLNSDFFKVDFRKADASSDFSCIEKKIFSDVKQLTDSEHSSSEEGNDNNQQVDLPVPAIFREFALKENSKKNQESQHQTTKKSGKKTAKGKLKAKSQSSSKKGAQKYNTDIKSESGRVDKMDVTQLLAMGETKTNESSEALKHFSASEDEMSDWEEVKGEDDKIIKQEKHCFPKEGVQITLDAPDIYRKRKEKGFDMAAYMKRRMNRVKREVQVLVHKVHLLCWVAHGLYVNSVLNSEVLMGLSLSLIPSQHSYPKKVDSVFLKQIVGWFVKTVPVVEPLSEKKPFVNLCDSLQEQFENGAAHSNRDLVFMFVCLLRSLGLTARLVISLQPLSLKPPPRELCDVQNKKGKQLKKEEFETEVKKVLPKHGREPNKKRISKGDAKMQSKALTAEEARQSNRKVMSKEEALKRLKSTGEELTDKSIKMKKARMSVSDSKGQHSVVENTRKSLRTKNEIGIKYKDASDSSGEESEEEKDEGSPRKGGRVSGNVETSEKREISDRTSIKSKMTKVDVNKIKKNEINKHVVNKTQKPDASQGHVNTHSRERSKVDSGPSPGKKSNASSKKELDFNVTVEKEKTVEKTSVTQSKKNHVSDGKPTVSSVNENQALKLKRKLDGQSPCTSQTSEDEFLPVSQNFCRKQTEKKQTANKQASRSKEGSDSDFEKELTSKMKQARTKSASKSEIDRRVLSSDSEDSGENDDKTRNNFWAEVLSDTEKWIPVDVISGEVNCIEKLHKRATRPVAYIVAWNPDVTLKDVTRRYCPQFHSVTRKKRVDEDWWTEALFPFLTPNTAHDKKENEDMQKQIQELPLPTSISEYKNHPLYALKRHLLKFEAIYPPDAPTLGFVKGEAVYPRGCVYTLHSRDIWLKEAKVVRLGEKPYKVVKARPKWDRMSGKVITDLPLEIFGFWQVGDYVPPTAIDGKVPRNAYGNVELFKPSMLPKGTVHMQVPALNRVAKKLQIDCAPAVVGFDFHCGASHPTYDGYVVCEEFQEVLLDAWNREQEEAERREREKRDKRVYGNWRRLIKGLLIRERLKIKYAFGGEEEEAASSSKGKRGKRSKAPAKRAKGEDDDNDNDTD